MLEPFNLRLGEIENIRLKLMQTIDALNKFLEIDPHTPWPMVQSQFTTLISRYTALQVELSNPYIQQLIAHPLVLPQDDSDFIPRVLLRSKLIPELEKSIPSVSINVLDEKSVKNAIQHAQLQLELHDDIVREADKTFKAIREEYDLKSRIEDENEIQRDPESNNKDLVEYMIRFTAGNIVTQTEN